MQLSTRAGAGALLALTAAVAVTACGSTSTQQGTRGSNATTAGTARAGHPAGFTSTLFVNAVGLTHRVGPATRPVIGPDDITALGGHLFVGFQNSVGSMGEVSPLGADSTVVEFDLQGHKLAQWDVVGKDDGLAADPVTGKLIATVNEDGNSSVYLIDPTANRTPVHYRYGSALPHGGGTDAIAVDHGTVLITASAPGSKLKAPPAVYRVTFNSATHVATARPLFSDVAMAQSANSGSNPAKRSPLALSDPDSSAIVPGFASRFAGQYVLDSQGDDEQIFTPNPTSPAPSLSALKLSASVDDSAWAASSTGALYTTDSLGDAIYKITGPFVKGAEMASVTPCNDNKAPSACPGPGYPQNYLGQVDPRTGHITRIALQGPVTAPKGMLFMP